MDKNTPIKLMLDKLIENGTILMCSVQAEASGSTLIKIRLENHDGDHCEDMGEATQNSDVFFRRKNQKQVKRDVTRLKTHQGQSESHRMNTRSRGFIEKPRCDISTPESNAFISGVPSPESVTNTPSASPQGIDLADQSPMHLDISNCSQTHQSADDTDYACSNDSHSESGSLISTNDGTLKNTYDQDEENICAIRSTDGESVVSVVDEQNELKTQDKSNSALAFEILQLARACYVSAPSDGISQNPKRQRDRNKNFDN